MSRTLLASFAHPDDEAFGPAGTLAKLARQGVAVHLITATRGEAGESDLADLGDCEDLACERELELRCAADVLGLADVHLLGYRDSGMPGSPANQHPQALMQADVAAVAQAVVERMHQLRPEVVLTFDPYGVYGHPDHIAIHRATVSAFNQLPEDERPQKLYFVAPSHLFSRWIVWLMPLFGVDPGKAGSNQDIDLRAVVKHRLPVTTRVRYPRDLRPQAESSRLPFQPALRPGLNMGASAGLARADAAVTGDLLPGGAALPRR